jgi:hypothetical protein
MEPETETAAAEREAPHSAEERQQSGEPASRPIGLWILTLALLASPVVHLAALLLHRHWLNFGSQRLWDGFVYFIIAPIVGVLMLRRHERARFSV